MKEKLRKHQFSVFFAFFWLILGAAILSFAAVTYFPFLTDQGHIQRSVWPLLIGSSLAYIITALTLARLRTHAYGLRPLIINFTATITGAILFMGLAAFRVYFSLSFLLLYLVFTNFWFSIEHFLRLHFSLYVFAVIPGNYKINEGRSRNIRLLDMGKPDELPARIDGIIVDFNRGLSEEWLHFIAKCILDGIPVISTDDFVETQEGTIILGNLTTAQSVAFQTASAYLYIKRFIDIILVLMAMPVWLPLMLLVMLAVRLESPGRAIFTQQRVGRFGKPFTVFKIRSMRIDSESAGAAFAATGDTRVTRIGSFIRKFRIDEWPQFLNVLIGDMSLIGPRPEQVPFVAKFEQSIPYYQLRHIVRPGITGWAQVRQGYAAGESETAEKLALDLYYVKRVSFTLDFLIFMKTLGTILTGFGAR